MKINFCLYDTYRTGGTRGVFHIAQRLTERGHRVTITALGGNHKWFPLKCPVEYVPVPRKLAPLLNLVKPYARLRSPERVLDCSYIGELFRRRLNVNVDLISLLSRSIPDCDINVATYCLTAFAVHRSAKGRGFYFVQHYEPGFFSSQYDILRAKETYYLPLVMLVTSKWLENLIHKMTGNEPIRISAGNHLDVPRLLSGRKFSRNPAEKTVMTFIRGIKWKNEIDAIKVMNICSRKVPNLKLLAVGKKKAFLEYAGCVRPEFKVEFVENPTDEELVRLYSISDAFISMSRFEGFNNPPLEAMACGTPIVVYEAPWNSEYVVHRENGLISEGMFEFASNILEILNDEELAERLRKNGLATAKNYDWDKVVDTVEEIFKDYT